MVHISLGLFVVNTVEELSLSQRSKSCNGHDLSLTSGEHRGAVCSGKNTDFCRERAYLIHTSAVNTAFILLEPFTHDLLLKLVHAFVYHELAVGIILFKLGINLIVKGLETRIADLLVVGIKSELDILADKRFDAVEHIVVDLAGRISKLFLAYLSLDIVDECNKGLDCLMSLHDGFIHRVLVNFLCARFDHDNLFCGSRNGKFKIALCSLSRGGVDDDLAVNESDKHAADRSVPRNIRDGKRNGSADHSGNFGRAIRVDRHDHERENNVVSEVLREQRTNRSVDNTAGEYRFFGGASLSLEERAGYLADRIKSLFVIDGKREEVDAVSGSGGCGCVCEYNGFAVAYKAGAV
ncbi:putative uncharacterized protein [Ruminococcus sp. CAG:382]|nr:putative uncharacterized protein [Ruminococcus sp. CAG:382]